LEKLDSNIKVNDILKYQSTPQKGTSNEEALSTLMRKEVIE